MIITLPETLSVDTLEQAIVETRTSLDDWLSNRTDADALHIDLARVEYVEFGALARVLLVADAAARSGAPVRIDLPLPAARQADGSCSTAEVTARRARCRQFLRTTGFITAGLLPHLPDAPVEMRNMPGATSGAGMARSEYAAAGALPGPAADVPRALTFRWVAPAVGEELWHSDGLVAMIRGLREIGLPPRDAQRLANAVLFELVENVAAHAGDGRLITQPHALVGAIALKPGMPLRLESTHPELRPLAEASLRSGRTLVRVVVGDSGMGLVRHLLPYARLDQPAPEGAGTGQGWSEADQIALWSMERWSTSSTSRGTRSRGTRGLWRAQRAVRSYGAGALLVNTTEAGAGYVFEVRHQATSVPSTTVTPVRTSPLGHCPGTLLDVTVMPEVLAGTEVRPIPAATHAGREPVHLRWLRFGDEATDETVLAEAELAVPGQGRLLLTLDGGPDHHVSHERLVRILVAAAKLARSTATALLVTGVDPVAIDAGIDALHHPPPDDADGPDGPLLLVDDAGVARWCGGSPDDRDLLQDLLERPLPLTGDTDAAVRLRGLLAAQPHIVRQVDDMVLTTIEASDVKERLDQLVTEALHDSLDRNVRGVLRGHFRAPNLHRTNRWVQVNQVLHGAAGPGIAAFLVTQRLAAQVPGALRRDTQVVQISSMVDDLSPMLAASARLQPGVHKMTDDIALPTALDPLPAGTRVIICADILLTESSVAHTLETMLSWQVIPLAVVAPLDARGHTGPVEASGVRVPVISLAQVDATDPEPTSGPVVDIDPVMKVPTTGDVDNRLDRYTWPSEDFLRACSELPSAIGLGHVVRPAGRHFTAYFDAIRVIDSGSRMRERIATEMVDSIFEWLGEPPADQEPPRHLAICHAVVSHGQASSRDGYARRLARLVRSRLAERLGSDHLELVEVPRAVAGSRYAFPDSVDLPEGCDAVIVDWGSFDATTILQLVRLAAEGGARRIFAAVLLSQLTEHDERAATMIRSVAGPTEGSEVPTKIRFLTKLGITPVARGDCTLCHLSETLRAQETYGTMPRELATHASSLSASLGRLNREDVAYRGLDAFGAPATTEDAIEYLRLRGKLLDALRSTAAAALVADHLESMEGAARDQRAHAIIRLLAAEQHWLGLLPIRIKRIRSKVIRLACAVASEAGLPERLRLQAITILVAADPETLVLELLPLWRSALRSEELLLHLLYQLWTLVQSGALTLSVRPAALREQIAMCLNVSHDEYLSPERAEEARHLLTRLLFAMDRPTTWGQELTAQQSWARLQDHYLYLLDRHSDAETAAINLLLLMEERPIGPETLDEDTWKTMLDSWRMISAFVQNHVLPYTPALTQLVAGEFAGEYLTTTQRLRLERLTSPHAFNNIGLVETQLHELKDSDPTDPQFVEAWREIVYSVEEWHRAVLAAGGAGLRRADLAVFLDHCPAPLLAVLQESIELVGRQQLPVQIELITQEQDEIRVFCHRGLLRNAIKHVIDNTVKLSHRQRRYARATVDLEIEIGISEATAEVRFRNTGTTPTTVSGKGITSVNRKLNDFSAALTPAVPPEGWTYEIGLSLPLWSADPRNVAA